MRRKDEEEYQAVRNEHFKQMEKHVAGLEKPPAPKRPASPQYAWLKRTIPLVGGAAGSYFPNAELGLYVPGVTEAASRSDVTLSQWYQNTTSLAEYHAVSEAMDAYWKAVDAQVRFDSFSDPNRYQITPMTLRDHEKAYKAELQALYNKSLDPQYLAQVRREQFMRRPEIMNAGINRITPEVASAHPYLAFGNNLLIGGTGMVAIGVEAAGPVLSGVRATGQVFSSAWTSTVKTGAAIHAAWVETTPVLWGYADAAYMTTMNVTGQTLAWGFSSLNTMASYTGAAITSPMGLTGLMGGGTGVALNLQYNPNANAFNTTTAFIESATTSMLAYEFAGIQGLSLGKRLLLSMGAGATIDVATQKYEEYYDPSFQGFNYARLGAATAGLPVATLLPMSPFVRKMDPTTWELLNYGIGTYAPSFAGSYPWP